MSCLKIGGIFIYKLLIVDDEISITEGLNLIVKRNIPECEIVGIAYNGIEGYELAMRVRPDIILTDISMPQADGLEMVRRLKENGFDTRVILLSGYSDFEYAKKGIELGVKFYINKPVEEEELFDCLKKASMDIDIEKAQAMEIQYLRNLFQTSLKDIEEINGSDDNWFYFTKDDISRIEEYVDTMDLDGCNEVIGSIFDKIKLKNILSLSDLKLQCLGITLYIIRKIPNGQLQLNEYLGNNILSHEGISRFQTVEQLKNWTVNTFRSIIELKTTPDIHVRKDLITEIKEYISENFNREISLTELSNRFFTNSSYISQLFREKTGDTYTNYIMKLRINKAKELLSGTDLKIYEVCELVGYSDTNYFSKLFEKIVGVRPSEYKKR